MEVTTVDRYLEASFNHSSCSTMSQPTSELPKCCLQLHLREEGREGREDAPSTSGMSVKSFYSEKTRQEQKCFSAK